MSSITARNSFLLELPSFKFNRELNEDISKCTYCNICDRPDFDFHGNIPKKIFCYQFVKNLEILKEKNNIDEDLKNMYCKHLVYWVYNKYYSVLEGYEKKISQDVIDMLNKVRKAIFQGDTFSNGDYCKNSFTTLLTFEDFGKRKNYHDYYVNYKNIKDSTKEKGEKCSIFFDYLNSKKEFYAGMAEQCGTSPEKKYCEQFDYKICDPQTLVNELQCNQNSTESGDQGCKSNVAEDSDPYSQKYIWEHCDNLVINLSDYRAIFIIGLAIWGLILTLFLFYKNTPVGLWIKNFLKKKEIIRRNFDEDEEHYMSSDNSVNLHENLERRRFDLGYYPE
ncbi:PIR Superfamily Protein [Plasmodium ovale wallikeri]|uniref:PIR Superfamily Protein n=2 Tax=Plasmodium ovale TaxID=36330 RepID=A0A1A9AIV3_PLAOA|nr:PIR Superfamily Protein [Plasmodium ovale wallikeri]SBT58023.1 PIR Superfamily Protein [Plasmodium ovale wallikeri]SBT74077.1 Plasmodium vivax Vir protein, putative [Plasmodium ovale]